MRWLYGRFLYSSKPTMAMAMIIAITEAAMYIIRSVAVAALFATEVGAGVDAAESTANAVSAFDGQYD